MKARTREARREAFDEVLAMIDREIELLDVPAPGFGFTVKTLRGLRKQVEKARSTDAR